VDEILVVGHCMGAMVGAVVIGQVAQLCADKGRSLGRLRFLTLASPMANYALLRDDAQVAPALRRLAGLDIAWLDYTAPQDPLCCFLVDAIGAVGVPCARRRVRFRMRSARFDKMVDPAMMQQVRRDPLRLHFLYLLATHRPVENDFFALTAGPLLLAMVPLVNGFVEHAADQLPHWSWLLWSVRAAWSMLVLWALMLAVYLIVPSQSPRFHAAAAGALVSAIGLEIARSFLHFYISRTLSLSLVYGSLGLVPVFMFWMYVIWMIVLVGLQVAVLWDALARRGLQNLMDRHPTNASA
jgi:hypothetical protein